MLAATPLLQGKRVCSLHNLLLKSVRLNQRYLDRKECRPQRTCHTGGRLKWKHAIEKRGRRWKNHFAWEKMLRIAKKGFQEMRKPLDKGQ
jgi:hypothetical protein